jgi:GTPase SAR1 family protein
MPTAATDTGRDFTRLCEGMVQHVANLETSGRLSDESGFAATLAEYFGYLQKLPDTITHSEFGYTALYEVDRVLEGFYSDQGLRLYQDHPKPMRSILVDCSALLQKFYLLPRLTQIDGQYGKLPGVDRFYAHWKEGLTREAESSQGATEYERTCGIADLLIQAADFSPEIRFSLISKLGEIVVTLGVDLDFVQSRLRHYADHIASREPIEGRMITGEMLLNLQALYTLTREIQKGGIPVEALRKALRYWSSQDRFLDYTFARWKWTWHNDYLTPVAWGEKGQLIETSELYRSLIEGHTQLGVGRSFLEHQEHRLKKPTELFKPIPIFILGRSGVGKSSFLTAVNYEVSNRPTDSTRKLTFGQQLQAFYDASQASWAEGKTIPTASYANFDFWQDVDVVGFCTYDYRGGDAEPQHWEPSLQEMFRTARGIIFMLDDDDLQSSLKMRARATWSRTILDYWRNSNPQSRHVPIAVVINKLDLIIPEAMSSLKRTALLPDGFQPAFVEQYALSRYAVESPDFASPAGRLKDCLQHDPGNNVHPRLQDLIDSLLEHFGQFFGRILDVTYHYQIFLMSSRAPAKGASSPTPWGVVSPLLWMTDILQEIHLAESVSLYESELKTLETEAGGVTKGLETLQRLSEEIADHQQEVEDERKKKVRFALTQREERIRHLQKLVTDAEADFEKTAASFIEAPPKNKDDVLAVMRRMAKTKEDLSETLRRRLRNYQIRKDQTARS